MGGDRDPAVKGTLWTRAKIGLGLKIVNLISLTKEYIMDPNGNWTRAKIWTRAIALGLRLD